MNKTISAILILLASAMATAAEPNTAATEPMVIAYNQIEDSKLQEPTVKLTSEHSAARFLEKNLDVVAASLNLELDDKISSAMTPRFDQ
tara:strand:+ start:32283 stop:32549 length:267 start_codon:yes stop_codon:yes gene_type:complete